MGKSQSLPAKPYNPKLYAEDDKYHEEIRNKAIIDGVSPRTRCEINKLINKLPQMILDRQNELIAHGYNISVLTIRIKEPSIGVKKQPIILKDALNKMCKDYGYDSVYMNYDYINKKHAYVIVFKRTSEKPRRRTRKGK